jgi:hypothetical protein
LIHEINVDTAVIALVFRSRFGIAHFSTPLVAHKVPERCRNLGLDLIAQSYLPFTQPDSKLSLRINNAS